MTRIILSIYFKGPERLLNDVSAASLNYGGGAMTDAVFYPNHADDISKVNEQNYKFRNKKNI